MLSKKLLRTIMRYKAQFISMIVMVTLGVGVFIAFNMEWQTIENNVNVTFEETGFADYRLVDANGYSESDLEKISSIDGVQDSTRYLSINTTVTKDRDTMTLTVTTNPKVSGFKVMSGAEYDATSTDGIWLSDRYADANNIKTGDTLTVDYQGITVTGTVMGLIKSGEYLIYLPNTSQMMPDFETSGFMYISPAMFSSKIGAEYYNQINVISDLDKNTFAERVNNAMGKSVLIIPKEDTVAYSQAQVQIEQGQTYASLFPVLFLIIAILTMVTTMHRITTNEKVQIGTLKALGFRDSAIKMHYTSYALIIGIIGTILGVGLGYLLAGAIVSPGGAIAGYLDLISWGLAFPPFSFVIIAIIILLLTAVGYLSVRSMLKGNAADALKPYVPKNVKSLWIERTGLWKKFGFGTRWNIRDTFRHKSRSIMTLIGVFGCVLLLVASFGMKDSATAYIDDFYGEGINYETIVVIANDATNEQAKAFAVEYNGDWASKTSVKLNENTISMEIYNIENDRVRFFDSSMNRIDLSDSGVYICKRIADDTGLREGDSITIKQYNSDKTYTFKVAGVISSVSKAIVMTSGYADANAVEYKINNVYTDAKNVPPNPVVESTISKDSIIKSFDNYMQTLNQLIMILAIGAFVLGLVVLYNLGTLSYIERIREMATLKLLGYRDGQISRILVGQNIWTTVLGIIIGIPLGVLTLGYFLNTLLYQYEMSMNISITTYVIAVVATLAISLFVGWVITRNNKKIDLVISLKGTE